jgi:ABC-type nitrate/sulfonate/bicarbonate transport system substrate-binding protein
MRILDRRGLTGAAGVGLAALALLAALILACGDDRDEVVFMAGFRPQASLPFVAVYVADAQGFYDDEELAVEIRHSPGGAEHVDLLEAREVDFTTATAPGLLGRKGSRDSRNRDLPIRAVALFGQRGDRGYVVATGSGIASPTDFEGATIGNTSSQPAPELLALLAGAGLTTDDVEIVRVGFSDLDRFLTGEIGVYPVFINNEPDTLRRQGVDVLVLDPDALGVPTLGLTLVTHEELIAEEPELVARFLRATLRGALYAAEHIDEAVEITLRFAPDADPDHQSFLLETDLRSAERPDGIGRGTIEQWQPVAELLREFGSLEAAVNVAEIYDPSIVERIYASGALD